MMAKETSFVNKLACHSNATSEPAHKVRVTYSSCGCESHKLNEKASESVTAAKGLVGSGGLAGYSPAPLLGITPLPELNEAIDLAESSESSGVSCADDVLEAGPDFSSFDSKSQFAMNPETGGSSSQADSDEELTGMTLVSPPFSPSQSVIDLAARGTGTRVAQDATDNEALTGASNRLRKQLEELPEVTCESRARIPTTTGAEIFLHVYRNSVDNKEHLAIVFGANILSKSLFEPREGETEHDRMTRGAYIGKLYPGRKSSAGSAGNDSDGYDEQAEAKQNGDTLVRIHSECYTGETAWSARCDCGEQLDEAARLMSLEGRGVIVYLRQEGRGIGLGEKLKAYNLQDLGADTVTANLLLRHPADARSFGMATAILQDLGQTKIRLLTNNPDKIVAVEGRNGEVKVTERVPMVPLSWQNKGGFTSSEVDKYLETKIERMGHLLPRH